LAAENRARLAAALRRLDKHDHLCIIYETRDEQFASVLPFIRIGLERGEKCVYIADENSAAEVLTAMKQDGIDVESAVDSGALTMAAKEDAYLQQGLFDPDWMIRFLKEVTNSVKTAGFSGLRIMGEMTWALGGDPGAERLIEYESKLNRFLSEYDCLGICQYNLNAFDPETLIDVIRTHPLVIYRDLVCRNFFYVPTDEFLKTRQPRLEMERLLKSILALEQSKEGLKQLKAMLQAAPLVIIRLSRDHKILEFNAEAENIYRCSQDQVVNHDYLQLFVSGEARPRVETELAKAVQGEATRGFENAVKTADGRERILSWHVSRVEEANGTPAGVVAFGVDITERKQQADELSARAIQQAAVAELGSRALAGKNMDELANDAVVLAKEALEVDLCKVLQLLPDGRSLLLKAGVGWHEGLVGQAMVGSGKESQAGYTLLSNKPVIVENFSKETRFKGPKLLWDHGVVSGISVVIGGPDRKPYGVMGAHSTQPRAFTVEDANFLQAMANTMSAALERAEAEAEIKRERDKAIESEANFRAVTETTGAAIFIIRGTKFRYQNQAAEALTGYGPKEIRRMDFWDVVHPDFQDLVKARGAARLTGEKVPSRYEFKMITKGGEERWLDYSGSIINFEGQRAILGTALDITEKKHNEEAEKRRDLDIRQAYIDVLSAVTGGRLIIATPAEITAVLGQPLGEEIEVATSEDISAARAVAKETVRHGLPGIDIFGLMVAAVEALANAVKHGGGGRLRLYRGDGGKMQMVIEDSGPGIDFSLLPKATLTAGFSTKQSLGMGFGIMLEECDRVLLATEPGRTIVVLEKERQAEKRLPHRAA